VRGGALLVGKLSDEEARRRIFIRSLHAENVWSPVEHEEHAQDRHSEYPTRSRDRMETPMPQSSDEGNGTPRVGTPRTITVWGAPGL
jgi:hypothetical protein